MWREKNRKKGRNDVVVDDVKDDVGVYTISVTRVKHAVSLSLPAGLILANVKYGFYVSSPFSPTYTLVLKNRPDHNTSFPYDDVPFSSSFSLSLSFLPFLLLFR